MEQRKSSRSGPRKFAFRAAIASARVVVVVIQQEQPKEGCRVKVQTDPYKWGFKPKMLAVSALWVAMAVFMFVTRIFAYSVPWGLLFVFAAAITPFTPTRREAARYK